MTAAPRSRAVEAFWREFCRARSISPDRRCDVFAFGDTPALANELLDLVLAGPKRATAALALDFGRSGDPLPEPGAHSVVLDGRGEPGCIIMTTGVEVKRFDQVDARFARDEGEGDRTLETWRENHRCCFTRQCATWGIAFDERMAVVLERFELVWPDRPSPR